MANERAGPNLRVLQYLGKDPQPSWVRLIASRALRWIGAGYLLVFLILFEGMIDRGRPWFVDRIWDSRRYVGLGSMDLPFRGWTEAFNAWGLHYWDHRNIYFEYVKADLFDSVYNPDWDNSWYFLVTTPAVWLALAFAIMGVLSIFMAPMVRRGRAGAARVAVFCMIPAVPMSGTLAAVCVALALINVLGLFGSKTLMMAVLLVPGILLGFSTLLLLDLLACLRWIRRAPLSEMPKREFR
jgi:hypothetical protein